MDKPLWLRWLRVYIAGGAIIGVGAVLFKYTTPTDEELINSLSPELRLQYERERQLRQAEQKELMNIVRETAKSDDPIWKTGAINSPWEKNSSEQSREQFQRVKAEEIQKEELQRIRQELQQIRADSVAKTQEEVKKSAGWKFW
ncbi:Assembly factor CBP4 [Lachancea thermotolerans]|uniref:Cytochrome b mRNA-processing protein 4 n=1 Tax=Lachancea thermotolerans (strain ATCC 56472 / CBS 6340 / NRRL Y-8284) TaxID=559295 RepID=C5DCK3_LACTC|nr:KLTH0B03762p [Lachancea thermotolerans CBS 6340]CAR21514.1 KLTH0B03762p [Lachancea thermotolerans CBS 6340]